MNIYFTSQFGFGHSSTYGSGYLETWGKSIGAQSCLVELPMPSSATDINNRNYAEKVANAIRNMLNGIEVSTEEGGTEVNEKVKVIAQGSLNVRGGPGTSYSIIASLKEGSIVTRIRKGVATANGYTWDKIRLDNGTEGYVATNYLELYHSDKTEYSSGDYMFVKDKDYTDIKVLTQEQINEGEREYNEMPYEDRMNNKDKLTNTYNLLSALCLVGSVLPHAGPALNQYKNNTGTPIRHGNASSMVTSSDSLRAEIEKIDAAAKQVAKEIKNDNPNISSFKFALKEESGAKLNEVNTMEKGLEELIVDFANSIDTLDWYLAFGYTRIGVVYNANVSGNSINITAEYTMNDYYDWDKDSTAKMFKLVTQQELWQLHYAGMARNFKQSAMCLKDMTW